MRRAEDTDVLEAGEYWVSYRDPEMHVCPPSRCSCDRSTNILAWVCTLMMLPVIVFMAWAFIDIARGA